MATLAALPGLLVPLFNPDIFWHLAAGDWILAHRRLPVADVLPTRSGLPWMDFEWLSQALFSLVHARAGLLGLWCLKLGAMALSWVFLDRALRETGASGAGRAAGLALFFGCAFSASDIRPELFSLVFFCLLLWRLEAWRAGRIARPGLEVAAWAVLFALWADFHAAFSCGWALIGCYAAAEAAARRRRSAGLLLAALLVCAAATLANPYGGGPIAVTLVHVKTDAVISKAIAEWHPMSAQNPVYWPFWPTLAAAALLVTLRILAGRGRARFPLGCALAAGLFAAAALAHSRVAPFFAAPATLLAAGLADDRGWLKARGFAACLAGYAAFSLWLAGRINWDFPFNYKFVPKAAADFMDGNREVLEPLRFYTPWESGGYLEWRLPWLKPYMDGRYLFVDKLERVQENSEEDSRWVDFSNQEGFSAELLPYRRLRFPSKRRYPDGSMKDFQRPWYLYYMPREKWALVYWDGQSMLFVDRKAVPAAWLSAHEYRYVRPDDDEAFADARARQELPENVIAAEQARHAAGR